MQHSHPTHPPPRNRAILCILQSIFNECQFSAGSLNAIKNLSVPITINKKKKSHRNTFNYNALILAEVKKVPLPFPPDLLVLRLQAGILWGQLF